MKYLASTMAVAILAFAATQAARAEPVPERARHDIDFVNSEWVPAMEAADAHRAAAGFADDVVFVSASGKITDGRAAFETLLRNRFASGVKTIGGWVKQTDARYVDNEVVEWGHSVLINVDAQGHKKPIEGLYVAVWRQNKAGDWKIVRNLSF